MSESHHHAHPEATTSTQSLGPITGPMIHPSMVGSSVKLCVVRMPVPQGAVVVVVGAGVVVVVVIVVDVVEVVVVAG